jgi:regulator of sigma E protease
VQTVLYVVEIAIGLGLIILVHELGHFLTAKMFGVRAPRFGFGLPFTRPILKWTRGETEYGLYPVLIGGFVHLVGESPDAEDADDPRGLWRRPAWQRIVVFSAGVVMNALLAVVFFILAPVAGVQVPVPVVGDLVPGMPAEKAGLAPGDRIVSINGHPLESFEDLIWMVALRDAGTSFDLKIERPGAGTAPPEALDATMLSAAGPLVPMLGIGPEQSTVIARYDTRDAPLRQAGVQEGDRILAVSGKDVATWRDLDKALAAVPAGPVVLTIKRNGEKQELHVVPGDLKAYDYGMVPPTEVKAVEPGMPAAEAGLLPGDRILAIQDKRWPTAEELVNTVKAAGKGAEIRLQVLRKDKTLDLKAKTVVPPGKDVPRIGLAMDPAFGAPLQVGHVDPAGPAEQAGLVSGDVVLAAGDNAKPVKDWEDLTEILIDAGGNKVPLQVERGGKTLLTMLQPKGIVRDRLVLAGATPEALYAPLPRIYNPITAGERGMRRTVLWLGRVYMNLRQILVGQVSTKAVGGPVAIVQWSVAIASHGLGTFLDFLGMLTVSIAVLNFLPMPPFDGGHVLFVLIDAVKRKPVSIKVRTIIWIAGWVAVGLLFIIVTYRDILRVVS